MSRPSKIPLIVTAAVLGGALALLGLKKGDHTPAPAPALPDPVSESSPLHFVSHDWIEVDWTPRKEAREGLLPSSAGADFGIECMLPNCRNCQIHRVWKASF